MLDFIRDMIASFRQASLERVRSPFLGAFVFSWLGFNWQMLAILFFSNREVEKRLVYITDNFGIFRYIIGPLITTALIAYFLPKINKFVTHIQNAPNTETIEMTLQSKIKIAELQQSIAEIEARKKLSEKREEKFIEKDIHITLQKNLDLENELFKSTTTCNLLQEKNNNLTEELSMLNGQIKAFQEQVENLKNAIEAEQKKNSDLNAHAHNMGMEMEEYVTKLRKYNLEIMDRENVIEQLKEELKNNKKTLREMLDEFSEIEIRTYIGDRRARLGHTPGYIHADFTTLPHMDS
ncbi:hypothetical protein [Cronobacter dublinensis]|uniref:hypothetical protein n=1 Tax=Cronobacter dublinensis TaxID=413497 RepID=UPI000D00D01C|nr:hypothetical protein [Cronobacter dublinensis]